MAPAPVIRLHPDDGVLIARSSLPPSPAKVTVTDLVAFALARALGEVPELNGTLRPDGTVARSESVHLALADLAGARTLMHEIDEMLRRRPGLGMLVEEARALRDRLANERGSGPSECRR